jgi:hypothetical protein
MLPPITLEFRDPIPRIGKNNPSSVGVKPAVIEVSPGSNNTIQWVFGKYVPAWLEKHPTHLIGIVIEQPESAPSIMPGVGRVFGATDAKSRFKRAIWAGPSGKLNQDSAFLFSSFEPAWTLTINPLHMFKDSGEPKMALLNYPYRIYFFSEGLGTWTVDPELDVIPDPDPGSGS